MNSRLIVCVGALTVLAGASCRQTSTPATTGASDQATGSISGHIRLAGPAPENYPIGMRADLMCDRMNQGQRVVQEVVKAGTDGSLANVFVRLEGDFPQTAANSNPVTIDQHGCVYTPRVVGIQIGQPLRVQNSDPGLHNVHGVSAGGDGFNVGQPMAGMVNTFQLKEEGIVQLKCDVHTWMVAFVGVVRHPHFAVTGAAGTFELQNVPVGSYTVRAWHERYGELTSVVRVESTATTKVELAYSGDEKPPRLSFLTIENGATMTRGAAVATRWNN
jgi:plastocyanin